MKTIQEVAPAKKNYPTKVIQFGEGNFLRAFIDWQIQQMNDQDLFNGGVAIVQPIQQGMVDRLAQQNNQYTVLLEGLLKGQTIESHEIINCINQTVNPYADYQAYLALGEIETVEVIFSNTTEAGIVFDPTDLPTDQPPKTFPGKLTALLHHRFTKGLPGVHLVPCELINHGGQKLKETILQYIELWHLEAEFKHWIETENQFYSTLVDRIVPGFPRDDAAAVFAKIGYQDDLLVKAEPFLLFVIEGSPAIAEVLPLKKAGLNVIVTEDMQPYRERKVRLLNGPHTTMAPIGQLAGIETVGEVMKDPDFAPFIDAEMYQEIAPLISLPQAELAEYIEAVKERFANPFVHHALSAIALNSIAKFKTRLLPTVLQSLANGVVPQRITLALASLLVIYGDFAGILVQPKDTPAVIAEFKAIKAAQPDTESYVRAVLQAPAFWETDLTQYPALVVQVQQDVAELLTTGARNLVQKINQQ